MWELLLYFVFCQDWQETRRELANPTFVGLYSQLQVGTENYVPICFFLIGPYLTLLGLGDCTGVGVFAQQTMGWKRGIRSISKQAHFRLCAVVLDPDL